MIYILNTKFNYKKFLLGASATLGVVAFGVLSSNLDANASIKNGNTITVESGDTLSEIATTYNTSVEQLANDNNITNQDFIQVGQQLSLTGSVNQQPVSQQPVNQQPVNQTASVIQPQTNQQPVDNTNSNNQSSSEQEAKEWIAQRESSGSYTSQNGQYYGRYQLSRAYLNGDYSPANQERVADQYVASRYGSWSAAKNFWLSHNYY